MAFFLTTNILAQQSIDGAIDFQNDPNKKYSIYVPSSYDASQANALMIGLHPLNTNRWDSQSWRDTLIDFAEHNRLILACPDGGPDGAVDDDIDTAFTSLLIDSMSLWFNIDESQKYLMGFSWGGKTVYSYGLRRVNEFAGFIPIGAAISGAAEISSLTPNALNENWYIVHGSNDSPNTRFNPAVDQLTEAGACLETNLLQGVGHTIDFPERNEILTTAFEFVRDFSCVSANINTTASPRLSSAPNPSQQEFEIKDLNPKAKIICYDINGQSISFNREGNNIRLSANFNGLLLIHIKNGNDFQVVKQLIR